MFLRSKILISLIILSQTILSNSQNFIFDFNGVLMGTDTIASLKSIGLKTVAQCMIHLKKGPRTINTHLKTKFFEILNNVADAHGLDAHASQLAYDETGIELPYLMRAWLDGSMTTKKIKKYIHNALVMHPEWFSHNTEKEVICHLLQTVFTPERFVETRKIYQECVHFIKICKKNGHKVYALSNWDKESFALLQNKYSDVFNLFDGIIISAEVNALKPTPDIYTLLLNRYNLKPETCWFIDDQQENVAAASALGIHGIICCQKGIIKKPNFNLVAKEIKKTLISQRLMNLSDEMCETAVVTTPL